MGPTDGPSAAGAVERRLAGTPYLVDDSTSESRERFRLVEERSVFIRDKAVEVNKRLQQYTKDVLEPFETAILSDIVAESNRIEGYDWTSDRVKNTVLSYRELLTGFYRGVQKRHTSDGSTRSIPGIPNGRGLGSREASTAGV
jgi:hypothetical protein